MQPEVEQQLSNAGILEHFVSTMLRYLGSASVVLHKFIDMFRERSVFQRGPFVALPLVAFKLKSGI